MELNGKVAVVTGGASGIGRAMAWRFADEGAKGVVVADLDRPGAEAAASEIGPQALGVGCDVTDDDQVRALVARAEEAFGAVDLFSANARVAVRIGLDESQETCDLAFGLNIRSHTAAPQALIPGWLERGERAFLKPAS